ncbi:MlaD family protein [Nocardioides limicola]|uniref:MlaD family protein n=1 Tax=Nocardioides limicola TaxID=2803368 RepID=UPI00193C1727|nr:MlaD family protein [Nocardioides sp. DJM-14]
MPNFLKDKLYLSAVGIVATFLVALAYLFSGVLNQPLLSRPKQITVELSSSGGLYTGSAATYRGVKVGKVTAVNMRPEGIEAIVSLTSGIDIPSDSVARVRSLSPVGEQYVDFQPRSTGGPVLEDGDVIPATATDIPTSLGTMVVSVSDVLAQIDDDKLSAVLGELSTALAGTSTDIRSLLDNSKALMDEIDAIWPTAESLLVTSDRVLDVPVDLAPQLAQFGASAKQFARFLREYDPELRRTLAEGPSQMKEWEQLVAEAGEVFPEFLDTGVSLTDMLVAHDPHLRRLLQTYAGGIDTVTHVLRDGHLHVDILAQRSERCRYDTTRRNPRNTTRRDLVLNESCAASFTTLQRGAAHAPGPVR